MYTAKPGTNAPRSYNPSSLPAFVTTEGAIAATQTPGVVRRKSILKPARPEHSFLFDRASPEQQVAVSRTTTPGAHLRPPLLANLRKSLEKVPQIPSMQDATGLLTPTSEGAEAAKKEISSTVTRSAAAAETTMALWDAWTTIDAFLENPNDEDPNENARKLPADTLASLSKASMSTMWQRLCTLPFIPNAEVLWDWCGACKKRCGAPPPPEVIARVWLLHMLQCDATTVDEQQSQLDVLLQTFRQAQDGPVAFASPPDTWKCLQNSWQQWRKKQKLPPQIGAALSMAPYLQFVYLTDYLRSQKIRVNTGGVNPGPLGP